MTYIRSDEFTQSLTGTKTFPTRARTWPGPVGTGVASNLSGGEVLKKTLIIIMGLTLTACGGGKNGSNSDVLTAQGGNGNGGESVSWTTESVITEGRAGESSRLVSDSAGAPAIAYIVTGIPNEIHLVSKQRGVWLDQVMGSSSRVSSLGLGFSNGQPLLSYFDGADLQFRNGTGSVAVDTDGTAGSWPSLVQASSGMTMLAFQSCFLPIHQCFHTGVETQRHLRFAYSNGGNAWAVETVVQGNESEDAGYYTTILLVGGQPVISYYDRTARAIRVARHTGGGFGNPSAWVVTEVATFSSGEGARPAMALSSLGALGISYYHGVDKDLYFAESFDGGVNWSAPGLVDRQGDVGSASSIGYDPAGNPVIAYYDATDQGEGEGLKVAWRASNSWESVSVNRASRMGQAPSLHFGSDGLPQISYFDGLNGDLMYSVYSGNAWPPESTP